MNTITLFAVLGLVAAQAGFKPERFVASGRFQLDSTVAQAFPMFEPIGEKQWAQGWDPQAIFPPDIEPAEGTVFETLGSKGVPSIWTITHFDLDREIEYTVVTPGHDTTQVVVTCKSVGPTKTEVSVIYRITGLSEKGNEFGRAHKLNFNSIMEHWREHVSLALKGG